MRTTISRALARSLACSLAAGLALALAWSLAPAGQAAAAGERQASAAIETLVPLAPLPEGAPWSKAYQSRQHLVIEAETKARLAAKAAQAGAAPSVAAATANQEQYDVSWYGLTLDLDHVIQILTGTTAIEAVVTGASLEYIELNLDPKMSVSDVRVGGAPAAYSHAAGILLVMLGREYTAGEKISCEVDYAGDPSGDYFGWLTVDGKPLIWTLSEPYGAREWWACKDVNTDKADSLDLHVTVAADMVVASNGLLASTSTPDIGRKTYHWRHRYPICTYLVSVTAYPYALVTDEYVSAAGDTMPLEHYVLPTRVANAQTGFAEVPDMITAFAAAFGEYPFLGEKYGHAHFAWGGGMEHQTCTSIHYNAYSAGIVSHELGHQWFGDLVTCADFGHIWLNEGFATWLEAYWQEVRYGAAAYHDLMAQRAYLGPGTIFVEDPNNFYDIFNYNLSYAKASWLPHMLRHMLGDEDWFAALQLYLDTYGSSHATTEDLQAVLEGVSGRDLGPFFQQWVYGPNYPQYMCSWTASPAESGHVVQLKIHQVQTAADVFVMPLDVRVQTAGGAVDFTVENDRREQWYTFTVAEPVTDVQVDPDGWVLCEVGYAGASAVPSPASGRPELLGAAPNPFNPLTEVRFRLPAAMAARVAVFDMAGRRVAVLADGVLAEGDHAVRWNGADAEGRGVASGTYYVRLSAGGATQVRAVTLVR